LRKLFETVEGKKARLPGNRTLAKHIEKSKRGEEELGNT